MKDPASHGRSQQQVNPSNPELPFNSDNSQFDPDHPISVHWKKDRFGFGSVARLLASSLLTQATSQGLVVSIEGPWGSGKSSLVNLLEVDLSRNEENAPAIVRFEPWLIGDRGGMLEELLSALASAVIAISSSGPGEDRLAKEHTDVAAVFLSYATKLSRRMVPLARLSGHLGVPGGEFNK